MIKLFFIQQLSLKFILLINVNMPTIVGIVVVDHRAPLLIYSGHKCADFKYWLVYNKSSALVIIIYTYKGGLWNKSQCYKKSPTPV